MPQDLAAQLVGALAVCPAPPGKAPLGTVRAQVLEDDALQGEGDRPGGGHGGVGLAITRAPLEIGCREPPRCRLARDRDALREGAVQRESLRPTSVTKPPRRRESLAGALLLPQTGVLAPRRSFGCFARSALRRCAPARPPPAQRDRAHRTASALARRFLASDRPRSPAVGTRPGTAAPLQRGHAASARQVGVRIGLPRLLAARRRVRLLPRLVVREIARDGTRRHIDRRPAQRDGPLRADHAAVTEHPGMIRRAPAHALGPREPVRRLVPARDGAHGPAATLRDRPRGEHLFVVHGAIGGCPSPLVKGWWKRTEAPVAPRHPRFDRRGTRAVRPGGRKAGARTRYRLCNWGVAEMAQKGRAPGIEEAW